MAAAIAGLIYAVWRSLQRTPPDTTLPDQLVALLAGAWLETLLALIVLFILLRRWPRSDVKGVA